MVYEAQMGIAAKIEPNCSCQGAPLTVNNTATSHGRHEESEPSEHVQGSIRIPAG